MSRFMLIAGPCSIESEELVMKSAEQIKDITDRLGIDYYFKSSFDKANRSSIDSWRGPGLDEGLRILQKVKDTFGLKLCTDFHEPYQAQPVAEVCDIIQIPAFLARQTDLLIAAAEASAKTGAIVNVKKGQFMAPHEMSNVIKKLTEAGTDKIMLCERGVMFGYNNLIVDMTGIDEMKKFGYPVVFDATHSVQKPGGNGTSSGGNREYVECLAKAAIAAGADHLFMEVHPDPDHALSDGPNMVPIPKLEALLEKLIKVYDAVN